MLKYSTVIYQLVSFSFFTLALFCIFLWSWCWVVVSMKDHGRIDKDLQRRGIYDQIETGLIPYYLSSLPLCEHCKIPQPHGSYHCEECQVCYLQHHHHCSFFGFCVAHRNIKAFLLSLIYQVALSFMLLIVSMIYLVQVYRFDSIAFFIASSSILICSLSFLSSVLLIRSYEDTNETGLFHKQEYLLSSSSTEISQIKEILLLVEKFLPIDDADEILAWPDVYWPLELDFF